MVLANTTHEVAAGPDAIAPAAGLAPLDRRGLLAIATWSAGTFRTFCDRSAATRCRRHAPWASAAGPCIA